MCRREALRIDLGELARFWDPTFLEDFEKIVVPSDGRVLRTISADPIPQVLDELVDAARTQGQLLEKFFEGKSGKASDALAAVERLGLIARPGGRKQPYVLVHPRQTKKLLLAAAELAEVLSSTQAHADADQASRRRAWEAED